MDSEHLVQGTVTLQGMPGPITGARVTFSQAGAVVDQLTSNPGDGSFETSMLTGTYEVTVEKDGFLPSAVAGLVVDRDLTLLVTVLWGDVNGDRVVDVSDLAVPASNQGRTESPEPMEAGGPHPGADGSTWSSRATRASGTT